MWLVFDILLTDIIERDMQTCYTSSNCKLSSPYIFELVRIHTGQG